MMEAFHNGGCFEIVDIKYIPTKATMRLSPLGNAIWHEWKDKVRQHAPLTSTNIVSQMMTAYYSITPNSYYRHCGLTHGQSVYKDCIEFEWIVRDRRSECTDYLLNRYILNQPHTMCLCARYPVVDQNLCCSCLALVKSPFQQLYKEAYLDEYRQHYQPLYTQKDKYALLRMLVQEAEDYLFTAKDVDYLLKVWTPWIYEKNDTAEVLTKQQKKDWKKREVKMKALLQAMAEKHAARQA
jgi:hypothetical protein